MSLKSFLRVVFLVPYLVMDSAIAFDVDAGTHSSRNGAITTSCFQEQAVVQPLTHVLRYPSKYAKAWVYQLESRWQDTHFYQQAKFFGWRKALHRRVHYAMKDLG